MSFCLIINELLWRNDVLDDVDDPIAGDGGRFGCSAAFLYETCELFGAEAAGHYMIGEDAFGQHIKCVIGWGEDRWSLAG